ncbi:MAG: hypothetical protein JWN14_3092 [Chthonomonadales bacterium]|nr:hypothetical protein [Chthonomonadales bacterium]
MRGGDRDELPGRVLVCAIIVVPRTEKEAMNLVTRESVMLRLREIKEE